MLNKLSYNLMNALNESEEIKVKKKVFTESTYLNENCKEEKLDEDIESDEEKDSIEERLASLKTQLEVDGEQLADDEKEAIKAEIAELENQLAEDEVDDKIMNESAPGTDAYDKLVQGDDVYFRNEEGVALLGHYADNYPEPEEYDEGFKPEYGGTEEGLQKAKEAAANRDVWEFMEVFEDTLQPMNEVYAYVYGQDDLMDMLKTLRQVNVVKKLEENQIEDARKDSIEKGLLSEAVFEIDYAPDGEDLSTENAVIDSVNKWLDPISDAVEVTVVELNGPSGWPVVRLSGNKEEIADFLYSNYNSGEDSLEDIIKSHLVNEAEEIDTEFKVGDVVKVPYKYGSYTPGEFTEAPIIDISEGRYVTVEIPSKLEVTIDQLKKWNTLGECDESLKEAYSDKLGGDPADFVSDVEAIKAKLSEIDTSGFGSHLAVQMVEDWIETCDYQIEKGKRLASGNEFYTEADDRTYKDADEAEYYRNKELYANSNLARHREAMEKAKAACEAKGIKLDECDTPIAEAEVKGLKEVKNQGNVYMLEDETNKFIVGENYNESEGLIENAEIYESKEEADKDYLGRCEITGGSEEAEVVEEGVITDLKLKSNAKKVAKAINTYQNYKTPENKAKADKAISKNDELVRKITTKSNKAYEKANEKARKIKDKAYEKEQKVQDKISKQNRDIANNVEYKK